MNLTSLTTKDWHARAAGVRYETRHFIDGRYADSVAGGRFTHAGRSYQRDRNEAQRTTLHGRANGFGRHIWHIAVLTENSVTLALTSPDGDQGFTGTLSATCTYSIAGETGLEAKF